MQIQCSCGLFQAELSQMPQATPGRCVCYCDDCQTYAHALGRPEILDDAGGTEIIPVYPANYKVIAGKEQMECLRLSPKGLYRWYAACCHTPLGNMTPGVPWVGIVHTAFNVKNPRAAEDALGPVRSRIHGRFATKTPPPGTSLKAGLADFLPILPFVLKGFITGKGKSSLFFKEDGKTPTREPKILSREERNKIRALLRP